MNRQVDFDGPGPAQIHHSTFVSKVSNGMQYLNYHTADTKWKPLNEFLAATQGAWFYSYRT